MGLPYFSVVMAVHNAMPHLPLAVESILQQTFGDFEFLIVDDHSTDSSRAYLNNLRDPRIKVIDAIKKGQTPALNQGIREAKANWIVRMDGDDWSDPRRMTLQKQILETLQTPPVLVTSDYCICDEELHPVAPIRIALPNPSLYRYLKTRNNPFCHPTVVFHAPTAQKVGLYNEMIQNAQDYDLWIKLLAKGQSVHVPELLLKYRVCRGSLSVLHQDQQTKEKNLILETGNTEKKITMEVEQSVRNPKQIEQIYHYKLGFAALLAGQRGSMWHHFSHVMAAGGSLAVKTFTLVLLTVVPRKVYLDIAGYRGVYQ